MNSKTIAYAISAHSESNHMYDNIYPYSVHLALVAYYAQKYIYHIPLEYRSSVIEACWLHDTIEDTRKSYNDILKISNVMVADIVYAVTNEKGKNRKERANEKYYKGIIATPYARYVKICDRLANVQYSCDTNSRMKDVYKKENPQFVKSITKDIDVDIYSDMFDELHQLINS